MLVNQSTSTCLAVEGLRRTHFIGNSHVDELVSQERTHHHKANVENERYQGADDSVDKKDDEEQDQVGKIVCWNNVSGMLELGSERWGYLELRASVDQSL